VLDGAAALTASGDFGAEWLTRALAARAHARLGELDSAAVAGRLAVKAVERLRGALASEALRSTYIADRADVYADLVLVLLRLGRSDEAFAVADAARSRGLLEHITAARSAAMPEIVEGERLLRRIDALVQRLRETESSRPRERGAADNPAGAPIAADLAAAQGEYEALLVRSAQRNPRAIALLGAEPARLDVVRAALHPGEVLLEYLVTPTRLIAFAVTSTGMRIIQSNLAGTTLAQRVRLIRDLWGAPSPAWRNGLAASRALDQTLIGPLRDAGLLRDAHRLFIVPHGILGQAPFAALQDRATGHFLAQDYAVIHLPSAAALPALRERGVTADRWSGAGTGFSPFPDELPATRKELEAVGASVPRARLRFRAQATESAVRRALTEEGLVHVATHGVLNVRHPMFSRIELARPPRASADDDGSLEIHELLGLSIRSSLVFLSGCETGAAQEWTDELVRGAGDLTLAQAVLSAGAANVITTLWPIEDAGAADFAAHFYRALRSSSVADAFAAAQRQMAADERYGSPYYWAGYTLSGDGGSAVGAQISAAPSVPVTRGTVSLPPVPLGSKP
jgi:CHAT domain-containing protein